MKSHIVRAHPALNEENGPDHCYFSPDGASTPETPKKNIKSLFSGNRRHARMNIKRRGGVRKIKRPNLVKTLPGARVSNRLAIKTLKREERTIEEIRRDLPNQPLKRRGCARFRPYSEASKLKYRDPNYKDVHLPIVDKGLEFVGRLVPEVFDMQAGIHGKRFEAIHTTIKHQTESTPKMHAQAALVLLDHNYMRDSVPQRGEVSWGSDLRIVDTPDVSSFTDIDTRRKPITKPHNPRSEYKKGVGEDYLGPSVKSKGRPMLVRPPKAAPEKKDDLDELLQFSSHQTTPHQSTALQICGPEPKSILDSSNEHNEGLEDMLSGIDDILKNVRTGAIREEDVAALIGGSGFSFDGSPLKANRLSDQQNIAQTIQQQSIGAPFEQTSAHCSQESIGILSNKTQIESNMSQILSENIGDSSTIGQDVTETAAALLSLQNPLDFLGPPSDTKVSQIAQNLQQITQNMQDEIDHIDEKSLTETLVGTINVSVPTSEVTQQNLPTVTQQILPTVIPQNLPLISQPNSSPFPSQNSQEFEEQNSALGTEQTDNLVKNAHSLDVDINEIEPMDTS